MPINRRISINQRLKALEEKNDELTGALGFLFETIEKLNLIVADMMLRAQGSSLEQFSAEQEARAQQHAATEEDSPECQTPQVEENATPS